jgi:hypothetical protein
MASKGRNGDSMLVHMTPGEVAGLHALAVKHGGSLTINPDTGLPEANFLKSLLPMLAGAALNFFVPGLGAAVGGAFGLGAAAGTGIAVGGLTSLATGSLSRGLMAGLGAYGGAGLTDSLMNAGSAGLTTEAATAAGTQATEQGVSEAAKAQAIDEAARAQGFNEAVGKTTASNVLSQGTSAAMNAPGAFLKDNLKYIGAAAAPIAADMMIPTTTKMPALADNSYIRQSVFDPGTQTYRRLTPVKSSEWGNKSFSDIYQGYSAKDGGIVALAGGGAVPRLAIGGDAKSALEAAYAANDVAKINDIVAQNKITAEDVGSTWAGFDTSGIKGLNLYTPPSTQTAATTSTTATAPTYNQYTNEQIASYLTANPTADIAAATKATNADPAAVNAYIASLDNPFRGSTDTTGGSGTLGIYNQMKAQGIDPNELYAAATAFDPNYAGWTKDMIQKGYDLDKGAYALSDQLKGVVSDKDWAKFMDTNNYSVNDMAQAFGLSKNEVQRRYDAAKALDKKIDKSVTADDGTKVIKDDGTKIINKKIIDDFPLTKTVLDTNSTTNAPIGTTNPYGNINNPGDLTFNKDKSITVQPNIPGRPYGGFSGMDELKNAYTQGGGSLGYVSPVVKTAAEHEAAYNKLTGDSMDAYNYLMGKGAYPVKSRVGEIMRPYKEAVLGYPASTNKAYNYDAATGKMVRNPDYVAPGRDAKGNVIYGMSLSDIKKYLTSSPLQGQALYDWATTNNLSAQDIADATGMKLSDVYAQFRAGQQAAAKKTDTATTNPNDNTGGSGGDSGGPGGEAAGGLQTSYAMGGYAVGGGLGSLGSYSDGGRLLRGPGDGVSDSIPATIGAKQQPARLADGEFVVPARIVSELGNGSTDAGAKKLYAMMDRVQKARGKTTGKNKVAANTRADKYLPA